MRISVVLNGVDWMDIIIEQVRISNYRSLKYIDVKLGMMNVLIGPNNSGKSNFLHALELSVNGSRNLSEEDIYVADGERLKGEKQAIIDIKIVPLKDGKKADSFSEFWTGIFTTSWIITDEANGDYVGIRTIIAYDVLKNDYVLTRRPINEWNDSIETAKVGKSSVYTRDMIDVLRAFYMDALRDVATDLRDRKSYIGRATAKSNLTDEEVAQLEAQLDAINRRIVNSLSAIKETNENISKIGMAVGGTGRSVVQIEPVSRKLNDLHKGMDISFKDGNAAAFSVTSHGMGTRSWISFLTLGSFVDYYHNLVRKDNENADDYALLAMEEPEAHLHPQAQRQIYQQLLEFKGQKIVSTHSSDVLVQARLGDVIQFKKIDGCTTVIRFDESKFDKNEIRKIELEVIRTHGDLIFSSLIVLCEGITEEQALPVFFKEFFGIDIISAGVNIIGVGGQNYKSYLRFANELKLDWCIFSDGEERTINNVRKAIKDIDINEPLENLGNVIILNSGYDFEMMTIKNGSIDVIIQGINNINEDDAYYRGYRKKLHGNIKTKRRKTDKPPCPTCKQYIYEDYIETFKDLNEDESDLYRCLTSKDGKAKYATEVAEMVSLQEDIHKRFPLPVLKLLCYMEKALGLRRKDMYHGLSIDDKTV